MSYRLEFWNPPLSDKRHNPFSSAFSDMPREAFATAADARAAADTFVAKYAAKGGDSAGGHDEEDDLWWIRDEVSKGRYRFTTIVVEYEGNFN